MKKGIYLAVLGLAAGELMMFLGHTFMGLAVHIINLQAITLALVLGDDPGEGKSVLQSLLLLLLMRIINLAMPQFFTVSLLWYPLVYGVMFIPIYYVTTHQNIDSNDIGFNFRYLYIYLPLALIIGAAMALIEYNILHPVSLITQLTLPNLFQISVVMFIFVAFVEELIFRVILQTRLQLLFGINKGLLIGAILFGIMHAGYGLAVEIIYATLFGLVLGIIFHKTRSFPFIVMIHGVTNTFLFGILPILLAKS